VLKKKFNPYEAVGERQALQKEIRETFGEEAIREAKRRLCLNCSFPCPNLLPITSDGKDCPYFKPREVKK